MAGRLSTTFTVVRDTFDLTPKASRSVNFPNATLVPLLSPLLASVSANILFCCLRRYSGFFSCGREGNVCANVFVRSCFMLLETLKVPELYITPASLSRSKILNSLTDHSSLPLCIFQCFTLYSFDSALLLVVFAYHGGHGVGSWFYSLLMVLAGLAFLVFGPLLVCRFLVHAYYRQINVAQQASQVFYKYF